MKTDFKKLNTWAKVCKSKGIHPVKSLPFQVPVDDDEEGVNAFFQISTIRKLFNDGKDADWSNPSEYKYYPWFRVIEDKKKPSGFGLSYYVYGRTNAHSCVGSRLSFNTSEKAVFAGKTFISIYEKLHLITPLNK